MNPTNPRDGVLKKGDKLIVHGNARFVQQGEINSPAISVFYNLEGKFVTEEFNLVTCRRSNICD